MQRFVTRTFAFLLPLLVPSQSSPETVSASAIGPGDFLVGADRGLEVWSAEGKVRRTIVRTPAPHPRWLDPDHVLILEGADATGEPDRPLLLSKVALGTGKVHPVAKAHPVRCQNERRSPEIPVDMFALREEDDFVVDQAGSRACLKVDAGRDAMSMFVTFDLEAGASHQIVTASEERCQLPAGTVARSLRDEDYCRASTDNSSSARDATAGHLFRKEALFERRSGRTHHVLVGRLSTYTQDSVSPSRRWLLLSGEVESEDSVHRKLVLVDTRSGRVFPLTRQAGRWPAAIRPNAGKRFWVPAAALIASGESDVRWLGNDEQSEVLVVDDFVFRPGAGIFSVKGNVAR